MEGESADAGFASLVGPAGDLNGDGFDDVLVTEPGYEAGRGRVLFYQGSATGLVTHASWSIIVSPTASKLSSVQAEGLGDVNKDGCDDVVVVGGFWDDLPRKPDAERVSLFCGSRGGLRVDSSWQISAREVSATWFHTAGKAGDVNGDGYFDIFVAAVTKSAEGERYRLSIYHGSPSGPSEETDCVWELNHDLGQYGNQITSAGDVNRDGFDDLLIADLDSSGLALRRGRVFLHHGSRRGLAPKPVWQATYHLTLENKVDDEKEMFFGWDVATAGDVDGDGFADVIIGAPYADHGDLNEGLAFVYRGSKAGLGARPSWYVESNHEHALLGWSVSGAGDVNGDGFSDVIVGVPYATDGQYNEGAAVLFLGSRKGLHRPHWNHESDNTQQFMGKIVAGAGDVNADGYADVLVAAPDYKPADRKVGRVYLFYGTSLGLLNPAGYSLKKPVLTAVDQRLNRASPALKLAIVTGFGMAIIFLLIAWRRALARLRIAERETTRALERERIARDLHDELGSGLARLALLKDHLPESGRQPIAEQVQQALRATEQIVWAVNPANDTLENLVGFILQQIDRTLDGTGIRCLTDVPVLLPYVHLQPELRKNVFLAVNEAVANALNHAQPTEVKLGIKFAESVLEIFVADNGNGLPAAPARRFGNGLKNMRQRMESIGGEFEIGPAPTRGTRVTLRVAK